MSLDYELEKAINKAKGTGSREAGRRIGQAIGRHNDRVKRGNKKRFDNELREITKYHEKRVTTNRTYHVFSGKRR